MPQIAGQEVGPVGYGLMGEQLFRFLNIPQINQLTAPGFTWRPNPAPREQAFAAMRAALAKGANFWNGGEIYGTAEYNSMTLLAEYFEKYPEDAGKVVLSIKGGINIAQHRPDGSPEGIRRSLDNILSQLKGRKHLDVFECARRDPTVPLSVTFGVLDEEYVKTGKLGGISLSECSAATIEEAVKATKVVAVEVELSLWSTDVLENGVAAACAKHGIPLIAYSPVGRGVSASSPSPSRPAGKRSLTGRAQMLTGQIKSIDDLPEGDMRRHFPRFQPEAFAVNLQLVGQVEALAAKKGCTPAQLAIAWCRALSRRPGMPTIIPIPGATTVERVEENATPVELTDGEMAEIDETLARFEVAGTRYPAGAPIDT